MALQSPNLGALSSPDLAAQHGVQEALGGSRWRQGMPGLLAPPALRLPAQAEASQRRLKAGLDVPSAAALFTRANPVASKDGFTGSNYNLESGNGNGNGSRDGGNLGGLWSKKTTTGRQALVLQSSNGRGGRPESALVQCDDGMGEGIRERTGSKRMGSTHKEYDDDEEAQQHVNKSKKKKKKQGTFMGVYIPVVASMWGVLIFIRFGVIVGYTGWAMSVGFVVLAAGAQILTTISLCTVLSNSSNYSGGSFGILKRNLGSDMAGVICLLYYFGMTTMASVELLGAVQAIDYILSGTPTYEGISITKSQYIDQIAIGGPILVVLGLIRTTQLKAVHIMATVILIGVILTYILGFLGIFLTLNGWTGAIDVENVDGFTGLSRETFMNNARPDFSLPTYSEEELYDEFGVTTEMVDENSTPNPASALSIIFPMFLGIFQGANKASDLETPNQSIIKGTGAAILTSFTVYVLFFLLLAAVAERQVLKVDFLLFDRLAWPTQYIALVATVAVGVGACLELLEIGPTILQAVASDGLFSFLPKLGLHKVNSKGQPVHAIVMVSLPVNFCLLFTPSAYFEGLATVVTMFFLQAYGHMHLSLLLNEVQRHSSWRPTFVYYHWSLALLGLITTVVLMFYISWIQAVVTISLAVGLLILARVVEEPRRKGLGTRALAQGRALDHILADHFVDHREIIERLSRTLQSVGAQASTEKILRAVREDTALVPDEPLHWDPQVLCLVEDPDNPNLREDHVKMVHLTTQLTGAGVLPRLAVVASTIRASPGEDLDSLDRIRQLKELRLYALITATNARAFAHVTVVPASCSSSAAYMVMMQSVGLGNLKPNMTLLNWTNPRLLDVVKNSTLAKRIVVVLKDRRPLGLVTNHQARKQRQSRASRASRGSRSTAGNFSSPAMLPVTKARTQSGNSTIGVTAAVAAAAAMASTNGETGSEAGDSEGGPGFVPDVIKAPRTGSDVKYSFAFSESSIFGTNTAIPPQFGPTETYLQSPGGNRNKRRRGANQKLSSSGSGSSEGLGDSPDDLVNDSEDDEYDELDDEEFDDGDFDGQEDVMHLESQAEAELHYHNKWKRRRKARLSQRSGTIDVWWFVKNGGLPVVIARLLRGHRVWRRCHIRVFTTVEDSELSDLRTMRATLEVERMLHAMRVKASVEVIQIDPLTQHVLRETILDEDEELISDMPTVSAPAHERHEGTRTLAELFPMLTMPEETHADVDSDDEKFDPMEAVRARAVATYSELMFEHSKDAQLVICNLPIPSEDQTPDEYVDLMERLTNNLDRVLFIHAPFADDEIAERFVH